MKNILITCIELSYPKEDVFDMADNNYLLLTAIGNVKTDLEQKGVEIWDQKDNIIVTEKGYICAFFEEQVKVVVK